MSSSLDPEPADVPFAGTCFEADSTARWLIVRLSHAPGAGFLTKLRVGVGAWTAQDVPLGSGAIEIEGFELGDVVALFATALGFGATASSLGQPIFVVDGQVLRIALTVSGMTGGTLTPRLTGGAVSGAPIRADGRHYIDLTASGTTALERAKDAAFDGTVSALTAYIAIATSVPQGAWDDYAEPRIDDIVAAMAGPVSTDIS